MERKVYCLGACASIVGLCAAALLVAALVLGLDYSGINGAVERQIDKVGTFCISWRPHTAATPLFFSP